MWGMATRSIQQADRPITPSSLEDLQFDLRNPRYGIDASKIKTEREALDHIVETFGITDVLSSLAVNGFFDSEPLVGLRVGKSKKVKILEGNRRLAACLILVGDERAAGQQRLTERYSELHVEYGTKQVNPVPVIVYEGKNALHDVLPYIGVRHIVGFLEWDSYAKAAWVDQVLQDNELSLDEIVQMVGDRNRTIPRMLGGYRFVNQLIKAGYFKPEQSQRKGRGSNSDYPFSWIYTALDNPPVKEFVGFKEKDGTPDQEPVPKNKLSDSGWLLTFMFGDKTRGIPAVVEDSRELGDLARAVAEPALLNRLKEGKRLRLVIEEARPSIERLQEGLIRVTDQLKDMSGLIVPGSLEADAALILIDPAKAVVNLSKKILADLRKIATNDEEGVEA
jgi:hypothetical protein